MSVIIAIETSCDETAVAVVKHESHSAPAVLSSAISSQINIHALTGGVVPERAAREHTAVIAPMVKRVMAEAEVRPEQIDAIAVTVGPGLMPALVVGVTAARTLAYAWDKPVVPIHHIEGHIYSALFSAEKTPPRRQGSAGQANPNDQFPIKPQTPISKHFPALALIVSGGHTLLIEVKDHLQYKVLGTTRDDAAGEAFDKVARLLGLPYPGGPALSKLAESGDPMSYNFTRPMLHSGDLDFSFSGLKTEVLYKTRELGDMSQKTKADISAGFQTAVVESLTGKVKQALNKSTYSVLILAGGVAANQQLRTKMEEVATNHNMPLLSAPQDLCGDNAVMIGFTAVYAWQAGRKARWQEIDARARMSIEDFNRSAVSRSLS